MMEWSWKHVFTALVIAAACVAVIWLMVAAMVRGTEADRRGRIEHSRACTTIQDQTLRTLCLSR